MPCWAVVSGGGERALSQLKPRLGALSLKRRQGGELPNEFEPAVRETRDPAFLGVEVPHA